jgi:tetratricopeptide (TPR) repeat protein
MFIGRDREMADIESLLASSGPVQLRAALDGLPGIGKTELARQVVARLSRSQRFPGGILWFNAEQPDLRMQWAKIAEDLGARGLVDLHERAMWAVNQVKHRARDGEAVLIVLDNVETWTPPPAPLPDVSAIRLLVTTRARWLHNSFRPYEVQPLELVHARQLLDSIVGCVVADADNLLLVLSGHVLSVELAATYLREYGTPAGDYLKQLLAGQSPAASVADRTSYRATAESAFRLLWQRITDDLRTGWLLAAHLAPASFSTELADAIGLDAERRRGLIRLHILERDRQNRHQMHRLLREFAVAEVHDAAQFHSAIIEGATKLLEGGDPALCFRRYSCDAACFDYLLDTASDGRASVPLIAACGFAVRQLGNLPRARELFERALSANRTLYDNQHPAVASSRANLALLLRQVGDLQQSRVLFEKALASDIKNYGGDHLEVAITRTNFAGLLRQLGDLWGARSLLEQALAVHIKTYGDRHPQVAVIRSSLALLLQDLEELPAARALLEQALEAQLETHGDDHPGAAAIRAHLARLLLQAGELGASRALFERALATNLKLYGEDHPEVATNRANIGLLFQELGDLQNAQVLLEQALASHIKIYGTHHPEVATTRVNLARVLEARADLDTARILFAEAFASDLNTYGAHHPRVKKRRLDLASSLGLYNGVACDRLHYDVDESAGTVYAEALSAPHDVILPDDIALIDQALATKRKSDTK